MTPKQKRISQEYGEPFWDVVKGYAEQGESMTATAAILEYSRDAFFNAVSAHGAREWFVSGNKSNAVIAAARNRNTDRRKASNSAKARQIKDHGIVINGVLDTIAGHAKRNGLSPNTVYSRIRDLGWPIHKAVIRNPLVIR